MPEREIAIRITGKNLSGPAFAALSRDLQAAFDKSTKTSSGLASMGARLDSLQKGLSKAGNALTLGVTLPVAAVGGAALKMAADAIESENLFEVSMKGMADAARAFSEDLAEGLGLNAHELRRQLGDWNVLLRQLGANEEAAYGMAKGLTTLAYDLASFKNLKPEEVFIKLRSGIVGETEAVKSLGIVLTEANMKQFALANGIIETDRALSESEKLLVRYRMMIEKSGDALGDMARTMDSPVNQMRRLRAQTEAMTIAIGMELMPAAQTVLAWIADEGFPAVKDAVGDVKIAWEGMSETGQKAVIAVSVLLVAGGPLLKGISAAIAAIRLLSKSFVMLRVTAVPELIAIGAAMVPVSKGIGETARATGGWIEEMEDGSTVFHQFADSEEESLAIGKELGDSWGPLGMTAKTLWSEVDRAGAELLTFGQAEDDAGDTAAQFKNNVQALLSEIYGMIPGLDQLGAGMASSADGTRKAQDAAKKAAAAYKDLRAAMREVMDIKFVGETAVSDQLFRMGQDAKQLELDLLRAGGRGAEGTEPLEAALDDLRRQMEIVRLESELTFEPQQRMIERLVNPVQELAMQEKLNMLIALDPAVLGNLQSAAEAVGLSATHIENISTYTMPNNTEWKESWIRIEDETGATLAHFKEMIELGGELRSLLISLPGAPVIVGGTEARQFGGPVMAGHVYSVGERGPESFIPTQPGFILPSGGAGVNNRNVSNMNDNRRTEVNIYGGNAASVADRFATDPRVREFMRPKARF